MSWLELIDTGDYPHIEATGMGDCYLLPGGRVRYVMWDWVRVDSIYRRIVTGVLTRPLEGLHEDQARSWQDIDRRVGPNAAPTLSH